MELPGSFLVLAPLLALGAPVASNVNREHRLGFLDKLLKDYDRRAWPTYGTGRPTDVRVNVHINSLGSVSAANMEYSMDIYLRQSWLDPRLDFSQYDIGHTVSLNGQDVVSRIWTPDIFFRNVKSAAFHDVTVPNKLVKMDPNGTILFSMRLTLKLSCHMSFRRYPMDTQHCQLVFGSYAQTADQVRFMWFDKNPIGIEQPLEISEFDLIDMDWDNFTRTIDTGSFSFLNATFSLERQNGYHLIQTYLPTFLIVTISWVSFWLNIDATPARVTLGVTTLLTLTTVASGVRTQLPPVSYVKAIDIWIGACSVMVFGALLEFTLVNYLSRSKLSPEIIKQSLCQQRGAKVSEADQEELKAIGKSKNSKRAMKVDKFCRVFFPISFFIFNICYWIYILMLEDNNP